MSNYFDRKTEFTPTVYTRYFEQSRKSQSSNDHIYFDEEPEEASSAYQIKRDLMFKRLFPSKYADTTDSNPQENNSTQTTVKRNNPQTAQPLGDFIPLSNSDNSISKKESRSLTSSDDTSSSSGEDVDETNLRETLPSISHKSIIGNVHSRLVIENVRTILIREFYQRTSDASTEWLKCKMGVPREYINPKYYADFQRRHRHEIRRNSRKKKSSSKKKQTENGYHIHSSNQSAETNNDQIQINEHADKIELDVRQQKPNLSSNTIIDLTEDVPEFIVLDSSDQSDNEKDHSENNLNTSKHSDETETTFFIDRSSNSFHVPSQLNSTTNEDYQQQDSKYAQLPTRYDKSNSSIIRPIVSKHQRRKKHKISDTTQNSSSKPLVSAIDRIIDQMNDSDRHELNEQAERENLLIKSVKRRKKKKKKMKEVKESN